MAPIPRTASGVLLIIGALALHSGRGILAIAKDDRSDI
jgi:hypothetical protein